MNKGNILIKLDTRHFFEAFLKCFWGEGGEWGCLTWYGTKWLKLKNNKTWSSIPWPPLRVVKACMSTVTAKVTSYRPKTIAWHQIVLVQISNVSQLSMHPKYVLRVMCEYFWHRETKFATKGLASKGLLRLAFNIFLHNLVKPCYTKNYQPRSLPNGFIFHV